MKIIQKPQSCPPNPQGNSQKKAIDREQGNLQPLNFQDYFLQIPLKDIEQIVGVAQLYFMPHPLLEIVQRLMAHPVGQIYSGVFAKCCGILRIYEL